jgi:hypothetical protein
MRILLTGAIEPMPRKVPEAVVVGAQLSVLPRDNQRRLDPARNERAGEGRQLDRFRPGPDDQPDVPETQPSP